MNHTCHQGISFIQENMRIYYSIEILQTVLYFCCKFGVHLFLLFIEMVYEVKLQILRLYTFNHIPLKKIMLDHQKYIFLIEQN